MTTLPKTLLQIAGASLTPSPLDRSALILIDHQLEYVTGAIPLSGIEAAIAEAAKLLDLARTYHVPVFHVVHHGRPGAAAFDPQGPYTAIMPELLPIENEKVVIKSLPNAFAGTNLHHLIQEVGRKELIIAGFATHMCVSTTTRAALDLGYRNTVVANATASRDLPLVDGKGVIPAEIVRQTALAELADRFAIIVPDTATLSGRGV
ncbi:isochorismatase family protein [Rhizobium lusitanum]|uniref:Nicotinamidase-related amidase n=1 Tax=Rhizobium lusitanum TaxID=293958 RepID=A0A7X0IU18_9HYPH|nr:isochorismatase family protein [Rhizobium lusitanum]MBB6487084.1 nicotinamidase-related amidase [Rhizobium lusitanum]